MLGKCTASDISFETSSRTSTFVSGNEQIEPRSGNPALDRALARSLANISRAFAVLPSFSYYDDASGPNAKASTEIVAANTDGSVFFGTNLLAQLINAGGRADASIIAICAHEFGHIASYKNGMIHQLNPSGAGPFRGEQFADYMAGYYAGTRKLINSTFPAVAFAVTQRNFGGGDHGSGDQRGRAVERGFIDAFQNRLNTEQAKDAGFKFSMSQTL